MRKTTLVIMAAGLASRFGGGKQVTPVDEEGQLIIDYSLYDAKRAGFDRVVFVIRPEMREAFHQTIGERVSRHMEVRYAFQTPDRFFPEGLSIPAGRTKPWGTAHAALCAREEIDGPFTVINADDYLGRTSFETIWRFLQEEAAPDRMGMIGYQVQNTLTEFGTVARGVCDVDVEGFLKDINERTAISAWGDGGRYTEDGGKTYTYLPKGTLVSMNLWGFDPSFMDRIRENFEPWLRENLPKNPEKCEYYLPYVPHLMISRGEGRVRVLPTDEKWYGVTYREDLEGVRNAVARMRGEGLYPRKLWE